ncbi:MAG: FGGY family carbohydrate kinase [Clostridiales bacterium]|nr:FGGY family carbohydrate kinase [Clostridiales bacterium]
MPDNSVQCTYPLAHLSWLKCHKPELLERAAIVCMSTEYVNFRLTGEWGIDNSTASTFYLQDQKAVDWHIPYLKKLGIPKWKLPPIHTSGTILGRIISKVQFAKADIARAIMEGTVYLLKMQMEKLESVNIRASSMTMVGGPSETFPWPQIVSDVLGMEIRIINGSCAGAVGAAILAGIGVSLYTDEKDAFNKTAFPKLTRIPDKAAHETYKDLYREFISKSVNPFSQG